MTELASLVHLALGPEGGLSRALPGFLPREAQTQMALAVSEVVEAGGRLVVEAGTGVGKTFAYLVPVLLSGQRALVSTATKALQDQLFSRDIPKLLEVLALPARVALLKGRGSYLCLHRMEQARHQPGLQSAPVLRALSRVEVWAGATRTGDLAELTGLDDSSSLWPWITSTRDNCLGSACPKYRACHVNLARKEAMAADVVVINHHLFFADLAVRESGVAELLPTVRVTIFDEAHQLNEVGVQFLGLELSTSRVLELARDSLAAGLQWARGLVDWSVRVQGLEQAARDWRLVAGVRHGSVRLNWQAEAPEGLAPEPWQAALQRVDAALQGLAEGLDQVSELAPDFVRLLERALDLSSRVRRFLQPPDAQKVRWLDVSAQLRAMESPLDIAESLGEWMKSPPLPASGPPHAEQVDPLGEAGGDAHPSGPAPVWPSRAWVFTSATLGHDAGLRWFTEPCGLTDAQLMRLDSPFDYARHAALYVPDGMARPGDPAHVWQVARLAEEGARVLGGRTLVLTTTLSSMRLIGERLQERLGPGSGIEVLVQGQGPKRRLMERFRQGGANGEAGCILVASASFWEGFDVPGDALQLVVIDKLPFPPPNDPVVQARSERLKAGGRSPFADLALPEAAVMLKQGAGRLIRHETDQGALVVCDARLARMGYGRTLLAALPPMQRLQDEAEWLRWLRQLREEPGDPF